MYIKIAKERFSPSSVCVKVKLRISILGDFAFLTPAGTSTLVATTKICIELLGCRTGPDPLATGEGSGPLRTYSGERELVSGGGPESCVAA